MSTPRSTPKDDTAVDRAVDLDPGPPRRSRGDRGLTSSTVAGIPETGIFVPDMGTNARTSKLADALFTPVQQRVLGLLYGQPDRRFQSAEIIRLARSGTGAVHRQLGRLAASGLVTTSRAGNQKYYQANRDAPVFRDLHGLVAKTVGLVEPLRQALAPLTDQIVAAFVHGSVARGTERAGSDIDLLVVSDTLDHASLYQALASAERQLERPINPTLLTTEDWDRKRGTDDSFVARISAGPRLTVLGPDDDLR